MEEENNVSEQKEQKFARVFEGTDKEYIMDGYLVNALKTAKDKIKEDWDFVFVIDGYEGVGKSLLAMQMAYFCDPTLNLDRYAFTPNQFQTAIKNAEKYQAVVYDEAHAGLNSRSAMTTINKSLTSMMTQIRYKNLFIFIVLPSFFDLDKYVAIWRSRALIHVWKKNWDRGYFSFYNMDRKKQLYVNGKQYYFYQKKLQNFWGLFNKHYPISKEDYEAKKNESVNMQLENKDIVFDKNEAAKLVFKLICEIEGLTNMQRAKMLKLTKRQFYYRLKEWKDVLESDTYKNIIDACKEGVVVTGAE